ncbi:MAG: molybdopterin-synthase adenylyltransferase MoeB [Ignavibacteriae bacterium]|nr:molybdopterin-synthase adenylyltransferase MoeB [Ignavibacteriota bacterium]MCB9216916.1 molybdopterin-synthase adenylyltransferase MoeB [Ignavibacteria bacterium]
MNSQPLTSSERRRYSRHIMLPEIGEAGQQRLKESSILLVGTGGLGSPAALYLAAAGVGRIGLVDGDRVDESNLQRQVLYGVSDRGEAKAEAAARRLADLNPEIEIEAHNTLLTPENAFEIVANYDMVLDGADNFSTRYLCNDLSIMLKKPLVHGSIFKFEGQVSVFGYEEGPCYRCIYPEPPPEGTVPSCGEIGVLGVLPGIIGTLQATEAIKLMLGLGTSLAGRILLYDSLQMTFREIRVRRDPDCPVCGDDPVIQQLSDYQYRELCLTTDYQSQQRPTTMSIPSITVEELAQWREEGKAHTLIDVRESNEYEFANIGGTLIPLGEVQARMDEIPTEGDVVMMCRSGGRSGQAAAMLAAAGRTNIINLTGGILAWADKVDTTIPKY